MNERIVKIGPTQMLFDLNGKTTNFNINFSVKSSTPTEDFYAVVVDQSTLDKGDNFNFQQSNAAEIQGNLSYDKNFYQNFFLCLKSTHYDHEVTITLNKHEIPPDPQPVPQSNPLPPEKIQKQENYKESSKSSLFNWKIILIVVLVVGSTGYLWYSSKKPSKDTRLSEKVEVPVSPSLSSHSSIFDSPITPDFNVVNSPVDSNIMSKLNKLKFK